jgi:hypothetical protein
VSLFTTDNETYYLYDNDDVFNVGNMKDTKDKLETSNVDITIEHMGKYNYKDTKMETTYSVSNIYFIYWYNGDEKDYINQNINRYFEYNIIRYKDDPLIFISMFDEFLKQYESESGIIDFILELIEFSNLILKFFPIY